MFGDKPLWCGTADTEMKALATGNPELSKFLPFQAGVGQNNVALRAVEPRAVKGSPFKTWCRSE